MLPESTIATARLINEDRERAFVYALLLAEIARRAEPATPVRVRLGARIVGAGEWLAGSCAYPPPRWRAVRAGQ